MRFDALHLAAFGSFTDRTLDLSCGEAGVHVIFGANEAGKSTALRAVHALLYGFPTRTEDAHLHPYDRLRVGADVRAPDGTRLTCFRRKGRRNTLLDTEGKTLPDEALDSLLGAVDAALFEQLFGIDHVALIEGGRALVEEHGAEGEALFGAGLGSTAVHRILADLDSGAQAVFAPRAQNPALNACLAEIRTLAKEEREATLTASRFNDTRAAAERAAAELDAAEAAYREALRERERLTRIRQTLGPLARHRDLELRLAALGEAPDLPEDFPARRREAREKQQLAQAARAAATGRQARLAKDVEGLAVDEALIGKADDIDDLRERLGARRDSERDRGDLEASLAGARDAIAALRRRLPPCAAKATFETTSRWLARRRRADELIDAGRDRRKDVGDTERRLAEVTSEHARLQARLEALPPEVDVAALRQAVQATRRAGELDERISQARGEAASSVRSCNEDLAALGRWAGEVRDLLTTPLPDEEAIAGHARRETEEREEARRLDEAQDSARTTLAQAQRALSALAHRADVPSERDLAAAREHRDAGWRLVREQWLGGGASPQAIGEFTKDEPLERAFELAQSDADAVADRLRREAAAVHEKSERSADAESSGRELERIEAARTALQARRRTREAEWLALWRTVGVEPGPPAEMLGWRRRAEELRERVRRSAREEATAAELESRRAALAQTLVHLLGPDHGSPAGKSDPDLEPLLGAAELRVEEADRSRHEREQMREAVEASTRERDRLGLAASTHASALAAWQEEWKKLTAALEVDAALEPGELRDHFAVLEELRTLLEREARLASDLEASKREQAQFAGDVRSLCEEIAPALDLADPARALGTLARRLGEHRERAAQLKGLEAQAREAAEEIESARQSLHEADLALADLARIAGGVAIDEMDAVETRDREHRGLGAQLDAVTAELRQLGEGASVEALREAARDRDPDALSAEIEALGQRMEHELEPARNAARERKVNSERDLAEMSGGADAAALAERRLQVVAAARTQAAEYVRLRLAARVLRDQIEAFRRANRDPVLAAAGRYLGQLTDGAFEAVDTDFGDADLPVLCVIRRGGERLAIEALSTGTRDQLYLALRLATLDHLLARSTPLPLVVDDVLVHFDDTRARAALATLAEFSRRTQVLLFTHHRRIVDDALALAGTGGGVFAHEL